MLTVDSILRGCARVHPKALAVTLGDEQANFGEIDRAADNYASALLKWGVRRGALVLVQSDVSLDVIFLQCALTRIGAIFVPISPKLSERELAATYLYLGADRIIVDQRSQEMVAPLALSSAMEIATIGVRNAATVGLNLSRAAAAEEGNQPGCQAPLPEDTHAIFMTSGSTGKPKGVVISNRANWLRAHWHGKFNSSRGEACMFPLYHMAGWQIVYHAWAARRAVHLVHRADAESLLGVISKWKASSLYAIPAVWERILECGIDFDVSSLRAADSGTSFVSSEIVRALRRRFPHASNGVGYGSTEIGSGFWLAHEDLLRKPGAVGFPTTGVEARIDDGELLLKADTVMDGYYNLPEETSACLRDGWYRTGDLAMQDSDGYFSIVGRRRDVIRSGGETISPVELERLLVGIEGVREIAIFGLPDVKWGEIVCAAVVPEPGHDLISLEKLRERLTNIAGFKHPRRLVQVSTIPRTPATGQVQREPLRKSVVGADQ